MKTRQELYQTGWTEHEVEGYVRGVRDTVLAAAEAVALPVETSELTRVFTSAQIKLNVEKILKLGKYCEKGLEVK